MWHILCIKRIACSKFAVYYMCMYVYIYIWNIYVFERLISSGAARIVRITRRMGQTRAEQRTFNLWFRSPRVLLLHDPTQTPPVSLCCDRVDNASPMESRSRVAQTHWNLSISLWRIIQQAEVTSFTTTPPTLHYQRSYRMIDLVCETKLSHPT